MPEQTITITPDQRRGLYELVRNHLASIEDLWVALERTKEFATAERLGLEFAEDFRLLADIGWSEHDSRPTYVLTMPAHDLTRLLRRLQGEAATLLIESGTEAEASRWETATERRFELGFIACGSLLDGLGQGEDPMRIVRAASRRKRSDCPHEETP